MSFESWGRRYFKRGGGDPFLIYVAFGALDLQVPLQRRRYRTVGVPAGFELMHYERTTPPEVLAEFAQGCHWDELCRCEPTLADQVAKAPGCVILRGSKSDPATLDYLRDTVGLLTHFLDQGAKVIYDPQMLQWWTPARWRKQLFEPAAPVPRQHVVVLVSQEAGTDRLWVHTRGMRKFGRPDLSVRRVPPECRQAVIEWCHRFIEFQALGGLITEGQAITMASLPSGSIARHGGHVGDPDFNNVHVQIVWEGEAGESGPSRKAAQFLEGM